MTVSADEILEDLELSRAEPGPGYLERLFLRFSERVPFETASKIRRDARVVPGESKPRTPDVFWEERLAEGAGGTCFARVAAFDALLSDLGFSTRRILGRVGSDFDHASVLVRLGDREWIADVGFPLPALLPAAESRTETGMGGLAVTETPRGWAIAIEDGIPEGTRGIELFRAPVTPEEFQARWEKTFRPGAPFLRGVTLRKDLSARSIAFTTGEIRIDDRHSRTRIPLARPRTPALAEIFGVDAALLDEAFAVAGDPDSDLESPEVAVSIESPAGADASWDAIRSSDAWRRLHQGMGDVAIETRGPSAWTVRVAPPPGGTADTQEAEADEKLRRVRVRRSAQTSFWEVSEREGRVWLTRRATLDGPRLDLLRNDSMRGRLAGILALDLLAWSRQIAAPI